MTETKPADFVGADQAASFRRLIFEPLTGNLPIEAA